MIDPKPHIAALSAYALSRAPSAKRPLVFLNQNESLRAPSPRAVQAAQEAVLQAARYPDPDGHALCHALSQTFDLPQSQIVLGAGSLDLIAALLRAYTAEGDEVLCPAHAYPFFVSAAALAGARAVSAPEDAYTVDLLALSAAVSPRTRVVCLANPANPTGTTLPPEAIAAFRARLSPEVLLIVDEAYGEFMAAPSSLPLIHSGSTVVLRTFSKAYGLAGFRIGWAACPQDIAGTLRKVMNPNGVSAPALAAAEAALEDADYMTETVALTEQAKTTLMADLRHLGLTPVPSETNFVLLPFETEQTAREVEAALRQDGVLLRGQAGAGLPHALRITLGPPEDMARLRDALRPLFKTGALR